MIIKAITVLFITVIMLGGCSNMTDEKQTPIKLTAIPLPRSTAFSTQIASPTPEQFNFFMLSPDGAKKIQSNDWLTFDIIDIKNSKTLWSFSYNRAKFGKGIGYLPEAGYVPFYWSQNGEYIYVYAHQGRDGGVKYWGDAFGAEEGVARFNTDTGIMEEVLPERDGGGYTFSISPDENSMVYTDQRETPIVLRRKDLFTNVEITLLTFDNIVLDVGDFVWFPNMSKLIFQTMGPNINDILLLDLASFDAEIIVREFKEPINFVKWETQSTLLYKNWKGETWLLDLDTRTINPIGVATPNP
jgi:hypothetical protein